MAPSPNEASKFPQILAAIGACVGAFGLGTGLAWTSPALVRISGECKDCYFEDPQKPMSKEEASWIGAFFTIGALVSSFVTGFLLSKIGRKWTMILMVIPFTAGWVLLTMAGPLKIDDAWVYYIGRLLTGFGGGAFALAAPIYISETSESSIRGALGSCMQFMLTIGVLFINGVGALIEWDILTGICIVFPLMLAAIMFFMPESPYYLVSVGKEAKARKALQFLRGKHYDIDTEFKEMMATSAKQEEIGSISLKEFFTKAVYLQPGLIMLTLMFFQQFSGINAVLFYLTDIFEKANVGMSSGLSATLVTLVQVLATGVAVMIVDRFGRKILLILSDAFMCISLVALGAFFYLDENKEVICNNNNSTSIATTVFPSSSEAPCYPSDGFSLDTISSLGWLPLTSLIVYIFSFSIGFGPLPWMMNGEFFSLESKALASTLATAFNWTCAFLVSKFETNIEDGIHTSGAYWMYACICALGVLFIVFIVPETRGKSPEEMKEYFTKK